MAEGPKPATALEVVSFRPTDTLELLHYISEPGADVTPSHATSPVRTLLGRGSIYTVATAAQLLTAAVALPIVTRALRPTEFGEVAVAFVVMQLVGMFARFGLPAAITRHWFSQDGPARARFLVWTTLALSISIALIVDLGHPLIDALLSEVDYNGAVRIAVIATIPYALYGSTQAVLRARDRARSFAISTAIAAIGGQILGIASIYMINASAEVYFTGIAVGYLLGASVSATRTQLWRLGSAPHGTLRHAGRLALPTIPHTLAMYLLTAGDRFVLERLLGPTAVGRYHVAYTIGAIGILAIVAVNNAWAPMIYESEEEPARQTYIITKTANAVIRLAGSLTAGIALAAPLALTLAAGQDYAPHLLVPVTVIVSISTLAFLVYTLNAMMLFASQKTGIFTIAAPIAFAINILANLLLIPHYELVGAALATLLSYMTLAAVTTLRRHLLRPLEIPIHAVFFATTVAGIGVLIALVAPTGGVWTVIRLALALTLVISTLIRILYRTSNQSTTDDVRT